MTDLPKKVFEAAFRLSKEEQDAVAEWLLAELALEEGWEGHFANTQGALSMLAREALNEHKSSETEKLGTKSLCLES